MLISKADCIAQHYKSSWRFLRFSEALHVYPNQNFEVQNHVSQKPKCKISNWNAIAYPETAIQVKGQTTSKVPSEKTPWL